MNALICLAFAAGLPLWPQTHPEVPRSDKAAASTSAQRGRPTTRTGRREAALLLGRKPTEPGAHKGLIRLLEDKDPGVRLIAAHALVRAGEPYALSRATAWLSSGSADILLGALRVLRVAKQLPDPVHTRIEDLLTHVHQPVRLAAYRVLEERAHGVSPRAGQLLLRDDSAELRIAGIHVLQRAADAKASALLVERLEDAEERVAAAAARALGDLHDGRAVAPLRRLLNAENTMVVTAALQALGQIGTVDAVDALAERISIADRDRRTLVAIEGLAGIGARQTRDHPTEAGQRAVRALLDRFERFGANDPAASAVDSALKQNGSTVVAALANYLRDAGPGATDDRQLKRCVGLLADINTPEVAAPLLRLLAMDSPAIPDAINALGTARNPIAVPDLVTRAQEDPSQTIRVAALKALTTIAAPGGVSAAIENLQHPHPAVRAAALHLWGTLNLEEHAANPVLAGLVDTSKTVQRTALFWAGRRPRTTLLKPMLDGLNQWCAQPLGKLAIQSISATLQMHPDLLPQTIPTASTSGDSNKSAAPCIAHALADASLHGTPLAFSEPQEPDFLRFIDDLLSRPSANGPVQARVLAILLAAHSKAPAAQRAFIHFGRMPSDAKQWLAPVLVKTPEGQAAARRVQNDPLEPLGVRAAVALALAERGLTDPITTPYWIPNVLADNRRLSGPKDGGGYRMVGAQSGGSAWFKGKLDGHTVWAKSDNHGWAAMPVRTTEIVIIPSKTGNAGATALTE